MLIGLMNNTSNASWSQGGGVQKQRRHFELFHSPWCSLNSQMGRKSLMLTLKEKPAVFLERTCSDVRKELQPEIGELLLATFRFMLWGSPLSLVQELIINVLGNCAVQVSLPVVENHSEGCPENNFSIWNTLLLVQSIFEWTLRLDDQGLS